MNISLNKKIIVSVISDVITDQRVQKECNTFYNMGYKVVLLGRKSKSKLLLNNLPYRVIRFNNLFERGPLMYLVFNLQLFFYLLFHKADILWANDLDALLPNFIISKINGCKLVYDSHEYFTLSVYKNKSRKIWEMLEGLTFPRLKNIITVSDSIKKSYEKKYKIPITVIRNVPYKYTPVEGNVHLPKDKKNLIMQGRGINENRGAEEAIAMMNFLPDEFNLYFVGSGTIVQKLKEMTADKGLATRICFIDVLPYNEMMQYTRQSFLGLVFEKIDISDHHRFALPNKFFDYIHAGIPVLSSRAMEVQLLMEKYNVGDFINNFDPQQMAKKVVEISEDIQTYNKWKSNTVKASEELNWQTEEKILIGFMNNLS